jgi:hypothetical protein
MSIDYSLRFMSRNSKGSLLIGLDLTIFDGTFFGQFFASGDPTTKNYENYIHPDSVLSYTNR